MDPILIAAQLTLGMLGVLGVATSEPALWPRQLLMVGIGLAITALVSRVSPNRIIKASPWVYGTVFLMLVLVLFIGVSPEGSESKRWLDLGIITVQPSELMKVAVIAYLAAFFYNHLGNWHLWRPMVVIGLAAGLIVAEPNVSTSIFIFMLAFAIMAVAGTTLLRLTSISVAAGLLAILIAGPYLSQYGYLQDRLAAFSDLHGEREHTQTISYQAVQARNVLAKAGFFGTGPGRAIPVPEAHTDMIAISVAKALGITGIATLIILYGVIALRGVVIASSLEGPGSLLAAGAATYICAQAALNLLVASGFLPVTGVVLPFVSYGSNSLVSVSIAMGFLHSAYRQARAEGAFA